MDRENKVFALFWIGWMIIWPSLTFKVYGGVSGGIAVWVYAFFELDLSWEEIKSSFSSLKSWFVEKRQHILLLLFGILIAWIYFQDPHQPSLTTVGMFVFGLFSVPFALYFRDKSRKICYFFLIIAAVGLVFAPTMKGSGSPTFIKEPKPSRPVDEPEKGAYIQPVVVGTSGRGEPIENAGLWVSFDEPKRGTAGVQGLREETNGKGRSTIYADVIPGTEATVYADKEGYYSKPQRGLFTYLPDVEDYAPIIELSKIAEPNMSIRREIGTGENFGLRREDMKVYGDFHGGMEFKIVIGGVGFGESFNDPILEIETEKETQVDIHSISEEGNLGDLKIGHVKCSGERYREYEITFKGNMDVGDRIKIPLLVRSSVDNGEAVLEFELNDLHGGYEWGCKDTGFDLISLRLIQRSE